LHAGATAIAKKFFFCRSIGSRRKKTQKPTMTTVYPESAAQYGLAVNQNHGCYQRGTSYSIEKKLEVAEVYRSHEKASIGRRPNLTEGAVICRVRRNFVAKVENERLVFGRVIHSKKNVSLGQVPAQLTACKVLEKGITSLFRWQASR